MGERIEVPAELAQVEREFFSEETGAERYTDVGNGRIMRRVLSEKYAERISGKAYLIKKYSIYSPDGVLASVSEVCKPVLTESERERRCAEKKRELAVFAREYIREHGIDGYNRDIRGITV